MHHPALLPVLVAALTLTAGCNTSRSTRTAPTVTTGLTEHREARMQSIVDDLTSKGYSEKRAREIASRQVPLMETTHSESLASVVTGASARREAEAQKFEKDLEDLTRKR